MGLNGLKGAQRVQFNGLEGLEPFPEFRNIEILPLEAQRCLESFNRAFYSVFKAPNVKNRLLDVLRKLQWV